MGRGDVISATSKDSGWDCERVRSLRQLLLLPRSESTEEFNPSRWREDCMFSLQYIQNPKFDSGNLLDFPRSVQNWDVVRQVPGEELFDCSEQFGKREEMLLLRQRMQFNEHVDGGCQGKDVVEFDNVSATVGPNVYQAQNWKGKPTSVRWEGTSGNKVCQETSADAC